jgi:hypothetical protein
MQDLLPEGAPEVSDTRHFAKWPEESWPILQIIRQRTEAIHLVNSIPLAHSNQDQPQ